MSPVDKAVWWTEYIIRHQGAPWLRSPAADISWIEFLMIDIIVLTYIALFIIYCLVKKKLTSVFRTNKKTKK